jgi:hypothetical protein
MSLDKKREELRKELEALNDLGSLIQRVEAHKKYISTIPVHERSDLQRVWILAYEAIDLKMAPGTEETLLEAAINLQSLDNMRQQTTKEHPLTPKYRPRFPFFGIKNSKC